MSGRPAHPESGTALITVLVMLAVMSVVAILVVDAAHFGLRRTANQAQMDQARWYLLGAERFAAGRLQDLNEAQAGDALSADAADWQGRVLTYPLDEGVLTVRVWDGSNCFNLNSVVEENENGGWRASARGQVQLALLMDLLDLRLSNSAGMIATLADYIDSDAIASPGGIEDAPGPAGAAQYRPANTLLGDVSELFAVRGFAPEAIAGLAPLACVRDTAAPMVLNVNTLRDDQAALLAVALGPEFSVAEARGILQNRPRGGWQDVDAFFAHPLLSGLEGLDALKPSFATTTRYAIVTAQAQHRDVVESSAALIEIGPPSRVIRRVFGATVTERSV